MPSFASFDGTRIQYTIRGAGRPLVLVNGLACVESYWKYTIEHFKPHMQIVTYDLRGHGESAKPHVPQNVEIEHHARDLIELVDHLALENPVVAGFSLGVQIMFEAYRQAGSRLAALIAVTGPYRNPIATFYGLPIPEFVIARLFQAIRYVERPLAYLWPRVFSSPLIYPLSRALGATKCKREDIQGFYDHQKTMDVSLFFRFAEAAARHSAEDVLAQIAIPTLIIGAEKDTFTPVKLAQQMARTIPTAEYLHLPGATHTAIVEKPEQINSRIERFLRERLPEHFERQLA